MKDRKMIWRCISLLSWLPSIALLLLYTYIPRYGIPVRGWVKAIAITCALCVLIIPSVLSIFLIFAAVERPEKRRVYLASALLRLASCLALAAYFPHSANLLPMLEEAVTGRQIWLDTSFELNPQGYTTVALISSLITYLTGRYLFCSRENGESERIVTAEADAELGRKGSESHENA